LRRVAAHRLSDQGAHEPALLREAGAHRHRPGDVGQDAGAPARPAGTRGTGAAAAVEGAGGGVPRLLGRGYHRRAAAGLHLLAAHRGPHRMTLDSALQALEVTLRTSPPGVWVRHSVWGWPVLESLHFMGMSVLIGTIGLFDLRLLGFARGVPYAALHRL